MAMRSPFGFTDEPFHPNEAAFGSEQLVTPELTGLVVQNTPNFEYFLELPEKRRWNMTRNCD
jgi:hypothetical protein